MACSLKHFCTTTTNPTLVDVAPWGRVSLLRLSHSVGPNLGPTEWHRVAKLNLALFHGSSFNTSSWQVVIHSHQHPLLIYDLVGCYSPASEAKGAMQQQQCCDVHPSQMQLSHQPAAKLPVAVLHGVTAGT